VAGWYYEDSDAVLGREVSAPSLYLNFSFEHAFARIPTRNVRFVKSVFMTAERENTQATVDIQSVQPTVGAKQPYFCKGRHKAMDANDNADRLTTGIFDDSLNSEKLVAKIAHSCSGTNVYDEVY
jgi:hypothetical protein